MRQEMKAPLLRGLLDWFGYHTGKQIQSIKVLEQILPSYGFSGDWPVHGINDTGAKVSGD